MSNPSANPFSARMSFPLTWYSFLLRPMVYGGEFLRHFTNYCEFYNVRAASSTTEISRDGVEN